MKGDRVEAVVDTGQGGTQTFEIVATKAGRRIEVTTARGIVEVSSEQRAIPSILSFGQSMLVIWPQFVALIALSAVAFALAYVSFMRQEVRA